MANIKKSTSNMLIILKINGVWNRQRSIYSKDVSERYQIDHRGCIQIVTLVVLDKEKSCLTLTSTTNVYNN